jgi:NADH-quinone oxidoreductase subunit H
MRLGWKVFLPGSIVAVMLIAAWRMFGPGYAA